MSVYIVNMKLWYVQTESNLFSTTLHNPEVLAVVQPLFCCLLSSLTLSNNL